MDISEEQLNITEAAIILNKHKANMLQFHVFRDKEQNDPMFASFFITGENGEPKEAIDTMMKLRDKWREKEQFPMIFIEGGMMISYLIKQTDTDGSRDVTRPCESAEDFLRVLKQNKIKKLSNGQKIVKRIEIPLNMPCLDGGVEDDT